jgi:hypothetical protein
MCWRPGIIGKPIEGKFFLLKSRSGGWRLGIYSYNYASNSKQEDENILLSSQNTPRRSRPQAAQLDGLAADF